PAGGEHVFLPPTLSYVAFSALLRRRNGLSSGTDGQITWHVLNFSRHERACRHVKIDPACGSPPCRVRFVAETSGGSNVTGRVSLPLAAKRPHLRLGGLGERLSSPSGSGRSPAAKRLW